WLWPAWPSARRACPLARGGSPRARTRRPAWWDSCPGGGRVGPVRAFASPAWSTSYRAGVRALCQRLRFLARLLVGVGDGETGAGIGLDAIGRDRVAQAVLVERGEAFDHLRQEARRNRHQQLVVGHAAVAPLDVARDTECGLAGRAGARWRPLAS